MNKNYYTLIGCLQAVEHALVNEDKAAAAVKTLGSIRTALLDSHARGGEQTNLHDALRAHVVPFLEAVETLRTHSGYQELDQVLLELMDSYYNISDQLMGGGGGTGYNGGGGGSQGKDLP